MALKNKHILACCVALAPLPIAAGAFAQTRTIDIPSEDAAKSIPEFARQANLQIIAPVGQLQGVKTRAISGTVDVKQALSILIQGTGLEVADDDGAVISLRRKRPAPGSASAGDPEPVERVTVTGSRIKTNGNDLPTPVTVLSIAELQATSPSNIPDGLNKLPIFQGGSTPNRATSGANGRGASSVGNFLNARSLGPLRTLILQDGDRVPGTFYDTTVDADMLPQMLIQRVEVVTGGASAVYGSDAVTSVVNFITDTKFEGIKALVQGGVSEYGDARSFRLGLANGFHLSDRGHFEWSVEHYTRDALPDAGVRKYGNTLTAILGSGTAAVPYTLGFNVHQSAMAFGGLATSGPFAGQQFARNGQLAPFNPGTPTTTTGAGIGGDGGYEHNESLLPVINTDQLFARFDYEFANGVSAYVQARYSYARSEEGGQNIGQQGTYFPITIYSGNPFLPASAQAQLTAANTPAFSMNRFNEEFSSGMMLKTHTGALAMTAGLKGDAWGDYTWDFHYTHGETRTQETAHNNINAQRYYAAIDAVSDPAGRTVCHASLTSPAAYPGCVPLNLFGPGNASPDALSYVRGTTYFVAHNGMDDLAANLTGTAFEGWAGPVKVALGGEYRRQSLYVDASTPDNSFNPQYLRLGLDGNSLPQSYGNPNGYPLGNLMWFKELQSGADASENIAEGNIELDAPLLRDLPLVQLLTFNGAYRYTHYSTAGNGVSAGFAANTWKLGLEWQMFDDLRLRATRSRDIRAPTLWELYQKQNISGAGFTDALTGRAGAVNTIAQGNPDLRPEVARNTTVGAVYTPGWLPGFSASLDYFKITIDRAIGSVAGSNVVIQNLCYASGGTSPLCGLVVRPNSYNSTAPGNFPSLFYSNNENIAKTYAEGVDLEMNYGTDLSQIGSSLDGRLNLRLLFTHQPILKTISIPGSQVTNAAGTTLSPADKLTVTASYKLDDFTINLLERFDSAVHRSANPAQVYDIPDIRPYYQTDLNLAYDFTPSDLPPFTAFLNINNLFDATGGITGGCAACPGLVFPSTDYADVIGRYFTVGVRFRQ